MKGSGWPPHVAAWAETEVVLAADLGDDTDDRARPRRICCAETWLACGASTTSGRVALRADKGYFAGQQARAAHDEKIALAIGAKRMAPLWRLLADMPKTTGTSD